MTSLHLDRTLPGSPAQCWRGLTEPAALRAWFWPPRFATEVTADPRPGGRYRIAATAGPGIAVGGAYQVIRAPRALAFDWQWDGEPELTQVTITLEPAAEGTALALTHDGFADDQARDNHVTGWTDCLDRLAQWLGSLAV